MAVVQGRLDSAHKGGKYDRKTGKQLVAQAKAVYDTAESVPEWGRGTVDKLLSGDLLRGTDGKLALSEEMLRVLVVLDRAGAFDR